MDDAPAAAASDLRERLRAFLGEHHVATLATAGPEGPWAAAVFYALASDLDLLFLSDSRTRHGRDLARDGRAAAAVHAEATHWAAIQGVQLEGVATVLEGAARQAALARYLARFPDVAALLETPRTREEARVAAALARTPLWRLRPTFARWIDNREGFGTKREWTA